MIKELETMRFYYIRFLEIAQKKINLAQQNELTKTGNDYIIVQVRDGSGEITLNGQSFPIKRGGWFITNNVEEIFASGNQLLKLVVLFFPKIIIENAAVWSITQRIESVLLYHRDMKLPFTPNEDASFAMNQCMLNLLLLCDDMSPSADANAYAGIWRLLATMYQDALVQGMNEVYSGISYKKRIGAALEHIHQYYSTPMTLSELARIANMSVPNFSSVFKKAMNASPIEYLNCLRIEKAKSLLENETGKIIEISEECGFFTISHFVRLFKRYTGFTPTDYRKVHRKPQ
ncbi:MAG: AraC family transcriptional regulator [Oscillospiraceae bacterium]